VLWGDEAVEREITGEIIETPTERTDPTKLDVDGRIKGFVEVELGYDEQKVLKEAARCLRCDVK